MSAKRKSTAIMQHHKVSRTESSLPSMVMPSPCHPRNTQENISTPEPADISEDDHYPMTGALMKDPDKLKLMLLAWNYNLQQQAHVQAVAALSPNNSSTTTTTTVGTPVTSQSAISTANNTINNPTLTESRNGSADLVDMPAGTVPNLSAVPTEDMASLWYAMNMKNTTQTSATTPSRSDRDRESSPPGGEGAGSAHDETSSSGNKEDEDDDDEDADERLDPRHHDPERLKAFNMFVRLFVDENLDRIVPISKQPKEKIQAIIDSCTRQFPEFAERARKRIRTYLKSCRRNKRGREGAPWDTARPTPAHLTSAQAEQILAFACENESENAKRMRIGLEPVSQPMPTLPAATVSKAKSKEPASKAKPKCVRNTRVKPYEIKQKKNATSHKPVPQQQIAQDIAAKPINANPKVNVSNFQTTPVKLLFILNLPDIKYKRRGSVLHKCVRTVVNATLGINQTGPVEESKNVKVEQTDVRSNMDHFSSTPVKSLPGKREDTPPASLTSLAPLTSLASLPSATLSSTPLSLASASKLLTPTDNKGLMSQTTIVSSSAVNGVASGGAPTAMYRPNFSQAFQRAGPTTVPPTLSAGLYPTQSFTSGLLSNGPTDLSMKNTKPLLSHKLNATEMTAVKQLITGYRESAAFLLRSADELEQLLLQQP